MAHERGTRDTGAAAPSTGRAAPAQEGRTGKVESSLDVIAFGTVFVEFVFGAVPLLPGPGEEVFANEFAISCGGAISVASAARAVGASAGLATLLGQDLAAHVVEIQCARTGVSLDPSRRVLGSPSGVTAVLNAANADRAFLSHIPPEGRWEDDPGSWSEGWVTDVITGFRPGWVYLHARTGAIEVIRQARRAGCRVAVDTELGTAGRDPAMVRACAAAADLFVPNARELSCLTGANDVQTAVQALAAPDTVVVVKSGADGATVAEAGRIVPVAAGVVPVEVRDCTGAGDAFAGAMLGLLAADRPLVEAVEAGNAAGSAAVGRLGAVGPVPVQWDKEMSQ